MSRVGLRPIEIPKNVKLALDKGQVNVEGPKGKVQKTFAPAVKVSVAEKKVTFAPTDESRFAKAMYGTARSVVAGMVKGVTDGFKTVLEIDGVGFKQRQGFNAAGRFQDPIAALGQRARAKSTHGIFIFHKKDGALST